MIEPALWAKALYEEYHGKEFDGNFAQGFRATCIRKYSGSGKLETPDTPEKWVRAATVVVETLSNMVRRKRTYAKCAAEGHDYVHDHSPRGVRTIRCKRCGDSESKWLGST